VYDVKAFEKESFMPKKVLNQQPVNFEQAMLELEQLVSEMEAGSLPLEASVAAYQRGSELVKYCGAQLDSVEHQVKVLEGEMLKPLIADVRADVRADAAGQESGL
jgi:exodeoxyribonuclease VII small subunit